MKFFLHLSKYNKTTEQWTDNCSRNGTADIRKGDPYDINKSMFIGTGLKTGRDYPAQFCAYPNFKLKSYLA